MKRRSFLKLGGASVASMLAAGSGLLTWSSRAFAATIEKTFYITDGEITQPDDVNVYFRGFSNSANELNVPGDSMIVQEGDTVRITVHNTLNTTHNFVIDGVVDSGPIGAGQSTTVEFVAGNAGTYMYHDNQNGQYNRLLGMHGGLAVMPAGSSNELYAGSRTFVKQHFWLFHDIDPVWHNELRNGRTPTTNYSPRYFTLNGLSSRPPGAPDYNDASINANYDPRSKLKGSIGDRTLLRMLNAGLCDQSVHTHANHMEWLAENGTARAEVWEKDCLYLEGRMGGLDAIFPFHVATDAYPPATGQTGHFPMHLHTEMSQTAGGGLYQFGAMTVIEFV
ncbi:MAG: multicopper oxidase domain-containing protein [Gammaproteobacteria bacterium]|nr:multicopper oxidase domain-containing protein [Gammaproteobacteria bacterium]